MNAKKRGSKRQLCQAIILGMTVLFGAAVPQTVWGGSLNANEAELMGIARGTFTYEGVTYRAKEAYINEAYYYLIRDDVDVTDEQKAAAIQQVYASVKQGIDEGYLYPVSETETTNVAADAQTGETPQNENQGIGDSSSQNSVSSAEAGKNQNTDSNEEPTASSLLGLGEDDTEKRGEQKKEAETEAETTVAPQIEALEHMSEFLEDMETEMASDLQIFPLKKNTYSLEEILNAGNWLAGVFGGMVGIGLVMALKEKLFIHHHRKNRKKEDKLRE